MDKRLEKKLRVFKRRIFLRRLLGYLILNTSFALLIIILLVAYSKLRPLFIKNEMILGILAISFALSFIMAIIKRPSGFEAAREADYNGLDEIVMSAFEISSKEEKSPLEENLYERAIEALEANKSLDRVKILKSKKRLLGPLLLMSLVLIINFIKTDISLNVEKELKEYKKINEMEEEITRKLEALDREDSSELLKELKESLKDIHEPERIDEEVFKLKKELDKEIKKGLEEKLSEDQISSLDQKQIEELLESENTLKSLNEILKENILNGNSEEVTELEELMDSLSTEEIELSEEIIAKLDELNDEIKDHNMSSNLSASQCEFSEEGQQQSVSNNLNKLLEGESDQAVSLSTSSESSSDGSKREGEGLAEGKGSDGAFIADNGSEEFEKLYESTFIESEGENSILNSSYKDFEEYKKMKSLGLGDTDEARELREKLVNSYISSQIDKSDDDKIPEALKTMVKEYYKNIGEK